jgi:hypothetical protein
MNLCSLDHLSDAGQFDPYDYFPYLSQELLTFADADHVGEC